MPVRRLLPNDWLTLAGAFAQLEPWMKLRDEADLFRVEVALAAANTAEGPQPLHKTFPEAAAATVTRLITDPPIRVDNSTIAYELLREWCAREGLKWHEHRDEQRDWELAVEGVRTGLHGVGYMIDWIAARTSTTGES